MGKSFKDNSDPWDYRGNKKKFKPGKHAGKAKKPKELDMDIDFSWGKKEDDNQENKPKDTK